MISADTMRVRIEVRCVSEQQPKWELTPRRNALPTGNVDDDLDRAVCVSFRLVPELVELFKLLRAHCIVHRDVVLCTYGPRCSFSVRKCPGATSSTFTLKRETSAASVSLYAAKA